MCDPDHCKYDAWYPYSLAGHIVTVVRMHALVETKIILGPE